VAVDDQEGEQQASLAAGQAALEALAVAFHGERATDLDTQKAGGRQGHDHILAIWWADGRRSWRCHDQDHPMRVRLVARGDSDDQVIGAIRGHMASDHPALLDTVSREDLLAWIQAD
jgi:hypothetical protein